MARRGENRRSRIDDEEYGRSRGALARWSRVFNGWLFGEPVDEPTADRLREIKGLVLIGCSLFLFISMASFYAPYGDQGARGHNWCGQAGYYLAHGAFLSLGLAGFLIVLLALAWGCVLVGGRAVTWASLRVVGGAFFVLSTAYLLQLFFGPDIDPESGLAYAGVSARLPYGAGGYLAMITSPFMLEKFGGIGLLLLLVVMMLVSFLLASEMAFYPALKGFHAWLQERREERGESLFAAVGAWSSAMFVGLWSFIRGADLRERSTPAFEGASASATAPATRSRKPATRKIIEAEEEELDEDEQDIEALGDSGELEEDGDAFDEEDLDSYESEADDSDHEDDELPHEVVPIAASIKKPAVQAHVAKASTFAFDPPTPPQGPWTFPPLDILIRPDADLGVDDAFLEANAAKLENALRSFRVEAQVVAAQVGPAVTLFELTVTQGTRMNKVTQLSQEIAAALRAQSVRIIAPIPGRETIGIEVPNAKRRIVRISELINQEAYDPAKMALPLFIGMDAEGGAILQDMAKMPHLLIAGTTGSGKSVCINTILASLLLTRSPHDVKMILIDPKMVELQIFANVPHLMCPVVTDARQATGVLLWAVEKMEGRYELFKNAGVKNVKAYNALGEDELKQRLGEDWDDERTPRHIPYIVVVVDEMADLMMTSKKEAELAITRLAQKSRAVGIHVIVATQRPSTDVITGVIKGNLPTRIAFQVASKIDSRVILDDSGADKLLGNGDMLFMPPGGAKLKRVQGALVEDAELQRIVDFVCTNSAPNFSQELVQVANGAVQPSAGAAGGEEDELWDQAVRVILKSKRGSASLLQRALGIGYTRASRLIDIMSEQGIVGPHKGSKVREIMMTIDQWEEMHGTPLGQETGQGANDE